MYKDICTLTDLKAVRKHLAVWASGAYSESDNCGIIRLYGDEIVCNDGHDMTVDGKIFKTFCAAVDETQSMSFAGLKVKLSQRGILLTVATIRGAGAAEVSSAIDKIVV